MKDSRTASLRFKRRILTFKQSKAWDHVYIHWHYLMFTMNFFLWSQILTVLIIKLVGKLFSNHEYISNNPIITPANYMQLNCKKIIPLHVFVIPPLLKNCQLPTCKFIERKLQQHCSWSQSNIIIFISC